ncbi:MAG: AlpA family phage regulatory protein [Gammaproteobacteria bacterium]|nr:AlpA family phage regulatory protein [Gammaproteobacteria bacterium]
MNSLVRIDNESLAPESPPFARRRVVCMLRHDEVRARVAMSTAHIYRLQGELRFPLYEPIARRAVGLAEHVLDAFLAERIAGRATMPPFGFRPPLPLWEFSADKVPEHCGIRLLRRAQVEALTGLPKSTFYPLIPLGLFPGQIPLGVFAVRWVAHEVEDWIMGSRHSAPTSGAVEPAERVRAVGRRVQ